MFRPLYELCFILTICACGRTDNRFSGKRPFLQLKDVWIVGSSETNSTNVLEYDSGNDTTYYLENDCYLNDDKSGLLLYLTAEDHFKQSHSVAAFMGLWFIGGHNERACTGPLTCDTTANVEQIKNYLIMSVRHSSTSSFGSHGIYNYTGAVVNINQQGLLNWKRFELRFAPPIGDDIRTCLVVIANGVATKRYMSCYLKSGDGFNHSVAIYEGKKQLYYVNEHFEDETHREHRFHLWGFQILDRGVVFFIDNYYSESLEIIEGKYYFQNAYLKMDVAKFEANPILDYYDTDNITNLPSEHLPQNWACPTLLLDYIIKFSHEFYDKPKIRKCHRKVNSKNEIEMLKLICSTKSSKLLKFYNETVFEKPEEPLGGLSYPVLKGCYWFDGEKKSIWQVYDEEHFKDRYAYFRKFWSIVNSAQSACAGPLTCDFKSNVYRADGFILSFVSLSVLPASFKTINEYNYTGAQIAILQHRLVYPRRIEVRFSPPIGDDIRICLDVHDKNSSRLKSYISCYMRTGDGFNHSVAIYEGIEQLYYVNEHFKDETHLIEWRFHLWGFEMLNGKVVFFIDNYYSEPLEFNYKNAILSKYFYLKIHVANFGTNPTLDHYDPNGNLPSDHLSHNWTCSALIVDQILIYNRVSPDQLWNTPQKDKLKTCPPQRYKYVIHKFYEETFEETCTKHERPKGDDYDHEMIEIYVGSSGFSVSSFDSNKGCYWKDESQKLIWEMYKKEFFHDYEDYLRGFVSAINNNQSYCRGPSTCDTYTNIHTSNNLLSLSVRPESYGPTIYNFTGAQVKIAQHKLVYPRRIEIRFAPPIGEGIRVCLVAFKQDKKSYISCYLKTGDGFNHSIAIYEGEAKSYYDNRHYQDESHRVHSFHLWGFQLMEDRIVFFVDNYYSEPLELNYTDTIFDNDKNAYLQISVANFRENPILDHYHENLFSRVKNWICPKLVLDYVLEYTLISSKELRNSPDKQKCPFIVNSTNEVEKLLLENICKNFTHTIDDGNSSQFNCFIANSKSNQVWKLDWDYQFDSVDLDYLDLHSWKVANDCNLTTTNSTKLKHFCTLSENVKTSNGSLLLYAKEIGEFKNLTGAKITSRRYFDQGRMEIMATYPHAKNVYSCIRTVDSSKAALPQAGELNIVCFSGQEAHRGLYLKDNRHELDYDMNNSVEPDDVRFHLHGIEWNETHFRYFYDHIYSNFYEFNLAPKEMFQIQLEIGFNTEESDDDNSLEISDCPIMMVNYVRFYKLTSINVVIELNMSECTQSHGVKNEQFDQICMINRNKVQLNENLREELDQIDSFWAKYWHFLLISAFILFLLIMIVYMVFKMRKMKTQNPDLDFMKSNNEDDNDSNIYENYIYENFQVNGNISEKKQRSYLELSDASKKCLEDEYVGPAVEGSESRLKKSTSNHQISYIYYQLNSEQRVVRVGPMGKYISMKKSKSSFVLT